MTKKITSPQWELTIVDADTPSGRIRALNCLALSDVDNDGRIEMFTGGGEALIWYRAASTERGVVAEGSAHVGLAVEDIDGDGNLELACHFTPKNGKPTISWFKFEGNIAGPWAMHVIDDAPTGDGHDVLFADVDGDGENELIVNACYCPVPGLFIYKRDGDPTRPWRRYLVQQGVVEEGLAVADFNDDGKLEIASGVRLYLQPDAGPFSGPWRSMVVAPDAREMCRVRAVDITGNGRKDLVIVDSEYLDGDLSWFENRMAETPDQPWVAHHLEHGIYYGHSLCTSRCPDTGTVWIMVAEMARGGWEQECNQDARVMLYTSKDNGATWNREILYQGAGTHEALLLDIDGDGVEEVVGKEHWVSKVQVYHHVDSPSPIALYSHVFIDRDKAQTGTDILAVDVDGDGMNDVVCAKWWYKNPTWEKFQIPGVSQVVNAYDIDGDGRQELIATQERKEGDKPNWLSNELCWLKPIDPLAGKWEKFPIGSGIGDWPHGSVVAPILPDGKLALVTTYHSAHALEQGAVPHYPELWEIPEDPSQSPWPKRPLADILYGEEVAACDVTGNGLLDVVAGCWWLENLGNGEFKIHQIADREDFYPARVATMDVTGNGRLDVILGQEVMDYPKKIVPWSPLAWFENPGSNANGPWKRHVIDTVRCAHSIGVADLDGDGEMEVICGEHYPFHAYRSRCKLFVYKKADSAGISWKRWTLDDRFEHHDGTKVIELSPGRFGIISHGWRDSLYVHLWEPPR